MAIAINTFKEAIRDKILYNLLFFALLMIGASLLLATLTVGEQSKIIIDIGLASINIFGVLIAVFLGVGLYLVLISNKLSWGHSIFNVNFDIWKAIYLILIELMVITAIALLFSTFSSSSTLSAIFSIAIYLIGHLTEELKLIGDNLQNFILKETINLFYYLLPNFDNFNVKGRVAYGLEVSGTYLSLVTLYGISYIAVMLFLSGMIFQKRDFK